MGEGAKRVCLLTSSFPRWRGDATAPFLLHLAQDLLARGWDVQVLAPHAAGAAEQETIDGVAVTRYRYAWPASRQTLCYGGGALFNLRRQPRNWLKLPLFVVCQSLALLRLQRRRPCHVIHAHWALPQGLIGAVVGYLCRVPLIVSVHGSDVFALRGRLPLWCKRAALRAAAAVTVNSSATEEAVRALAPELKTLRRIPIGVRLDRTMPARSRASSTGPHVLFVGRLVAQKGADDLLRALALLVTDWPAASATLVGDGPEQPSLQHLARELGVAERVRFAGSVAPERVGDYLAAADVFLAPAKAVPDGGAEGQGLAILEAMQAGVPVVASRSGGIVDAVRHGETGLLVDENAPLQIASAVSRLRRDPKLTEGLTQRARAMVAEAYGAGRTADAFAELFAEVLTQDHRGAQARIVT